MQSFAVTFPLETRLKPARHNSVSHRAVIFYIALLAPLLLRAAVSNAQPSAVSTSVQAATPPAIVSTNAPDPDGCDTNWMTGIARDTTIWEILFRWSAWQSCSFRQRILIKHQELFEWMNERVQRGDEYFMDPTAPAKREDSFFSLEVIFSVDDNAESVGIDQSVNARLAIPNIENRLHLFINNLKPMTLPGTDPRDQIGDPRVGLRGVLQKTDFSFIHLDGGIRWSGGPVAFTELTLSYSIKAKGWNLGFENSEAYYTDDDGLSTMNQIGLMRKLSPEILFRAVSACKWGQNTWGVEFSEMMYLGYIIAGENDRLGAEAIGLRGVVFWHKNGPALMDNTRIKLEYRRRGFRKWLYYTLTPILEFPQDNEFKPTVSLEAGVQIFFFNDEGLPF